MEGQSMPIISSSMLDDGWVVLGFMFIIGSILIVLGFVLILS